jgi:serine/threonine protein kinase
MTERFTLLSELGRGAMGVVWKAHDEETGSIVALKLLREVYAEDPEYLARFERELELAKRIYSRNVVEVLGFGVRGKVPYLALEYVDGPSLHDALVAHGPYSWTETRAILTQLTQGLADAHAAGVVHRDVKPSNVLIGPDGVAKLTDFGIARGLDLTRVTATSTLLGTPAYLAPEGPKDGRSDLYSLGVIGYELLTGAVPFKGTTYQEVIVEHVRTPPDLTKLPAEARPIIGWLLAKDPAARPQRASDLLPVLYGAAQVLEVRGVGAGVAPVQPVAASTLPVADHPPATTRRTSKPLIFSLAIAALVVCLLAVVLAGSFFSSKPTSPATFTPLTIATGSATPAPNAGTFGLTGSMASARSSQTATLLADGRVLIAGGLDFSSRTVFATAELFSPKTGTFSSIGSMSTARDGHTATLLSDGRVLIAGGWATGSKISASAELYDPKTGTFDPTGSMSTARGGETAALLADGRVLVAGGSDGSNSLASAELYDPKTGAFSPTGSMATAREGQTATVLADGRVLIVGGSVGLGESLATAELYDPRTGTFSPIGSMSTARDGHTATLLADGRVLVAGGTGLATAELYDPRTGTFSLTASASTGRGSHTATLLSDGRVLIAGGIAGGTGLATAELYDPKTGTFGPTGSMTTAREYAVATSLSDGRVLIVGGEAGDDHMALASAELYQP